MGGCLVIVLDTSALLFYLFEPESLSSSAIATIEQADRIIISAISIWEIALKSKKGKLSIPLSVVEMVQLLQRAERIRFRSVDVGIWLENVSLEWRHKDPADRTIVATAKLLACPLVTSDREIRTFYRRAVW